MTAILINSSCLRTPEHGISHQYHSDIGNIFQLSPSLLYQFAFVNNCVVEYWVWVAVVAFADTRTTVVRYFSATHLTPIICCKMILRCFVRCNQVLQYYLILFTVPYYFHTAHFASTSLFCSLPPTRLLAVVVVRDFCYDEIKLK